MFAGTGPLEILRVTNHAVHALLGLFQLFLGGPENDVVEIAVARVRDDSAGQTVFGNVGFGTFDQLGQVRDGDA